MYRLFAMFSVILLLSGSIVSARTNSLQSEAGDFVLGYALPGECRALSLDGSLIVTGKGVNELATGMQRFTIDVDRYTGWIVFSPDGSLLAIQGDGLYEIASGERRFALEDGYGLFFTPDGSRLLDYDAGILYDTASGNHRLEISVEGGTLSDDGSLLIDRVEGVVYETATGDRRFSFGPVYSSRALFSPDDLFIAVIGAGLYEVATGRRLFPFEGSDLSFSADSSLVFVLGDAIYDVATGQRRVELGEHSFQDVALNPNSTLVAISGDGVYDLETGRQRVAFRASEYFLGDPEFSPDGMSVVVPLDALYDLQTGVRRFEVSAGDFNPHFSPDSSMVFIEEYLPGVAYVYKVATGELMYQLQDSGREGRSVFKMNGSILVAGNNVVDAVTGDPLFDSSRVVLSEDAALAAVSTEQGGVLYEVTSRNPRFQYEGSAESFSADGKLLFVRNGDDNIFSAYAVASGERLISTTSRRESSSNGSIAIVTSAAFGNPCAVLGPADYAWPYRSGLVASNGAITIRSAPAGDSTVVAEEYEGELVVFSRTADDLWFRVGAPDDDPAWVSAADVTIMSMPDGVPVEEE